MKNLICTIEARMGSTRLPGKSMMTLFKQYKLIDFVILNALQSNYLSKKNIYILTSKKKNNYKLINYIKDKYELKTVIGSEKNVLSRYLKLKRINSTVVRLTADNPMVDPSFIDKSIKYFKKIKADYASSRSMADSLRWKVKSDYPKGISIELFKMKDLLKFKKKFNRKNWEYPTWIFYNKIFTGKISKIKLFKGYSKVNNFSFTIDTKQDLKRLKSLISKHNFKPGENNFQKYIKNLKSRNR
jgi:spore coat polysaccharide biosynthesis protein SpsF (cytidylyltransferase family)